ncbi:hypothetical protein [Clostridium beijerinckii]|uniref:hypothetical protein n=1 Tax=Clostridium beijerinckii TaxID=1520 RepID=UPI0023302A72|nr:hypothetical protein [Clostridium beijerinckii]
MVKKSRVYYLISTGEILLKTSECFSDNDLSIAQTTIQQDIESYPELKGKNSNEIDYIELEYGTLASTFTNAKSYKINLNSKKLEVTYYTQEELNAIQQQDQQNEDLNSRVLDISAYLNRNVTTIADVEDLILQSEQNKIINGGI